MELVEETPEETQTPQPFVNEEISEDTEKEKGVLGN